MNPTPLTNPRYPIVNAMTVDVEDYFQVSAFDGVVKRDKWDSMPSRVEANTERLLGMFHEAGVMATFFVLGWVADRHPRLVLNIAGAGHELASHGYGHRLVYDQTEATFREDVRRAKAIIEDRSGQEVRGYRAPSYSITKRSLWALDVLAEEGYAYDASIFPIRHDRYGIPDAPRHPYVVATSSTSSTCSTGRNGSTLTEAPPSTVRVAGTNLPIAGGGYFRLLPYWWTRWGIGQLNAKERRPAIFYLHPWEVDPEQPRLNANALSRFRHYRNLDKTEPRLRQLLRDFRFDTLAALLSSRSFPSFPSFSSFPSLQRGRG